MTSWQRNAIVLATIASQLLAGTMSGRAIYLGHCGDHGQHQHDEHDSDCEPEDDCAALLGHDHLSHLGHAHRCRCPHFHVQYELREAERIHLGHSRPGTLAFAPKSLQSAATTTPKHGWAARASVPVSDPVPPQSLRAVRTTRLLV